ncbi:MAG: InlB B-repeat-containing protein, partial [Eubacteriales bacterium]
MKNRLLSAILALCLICALLSGCGQSYTVTLNENYPDGNTTEISTSSAKAIAEETPVREGYVFEGWFKDENLTDPWDAASDKVK